MTHQKSFIIYKDSLSIRKKLTTEQKAALFDAISDYQIDQKLPEDNLISIIFEPFLNQFIRDQEKWEKVRVARTVAGSKGGKQKVANASKGKQKQANLAVSVNDNVNDNVNVSEEGEKPKGFIPPTFEEVKNYCTERNNNVDADKFLNFYESKGWLVGKSKMKDWKASVRTWEKPRESNTTRPTKTDHNKAILQQFINETGGSNE